MASGDETILFLYSVFPQYLYSHDSNSRFAFQVVHVLSNIIVLMVLAFPGLIPVRKYRSVRTVLTHRLYVVSRTQQPSVYLILIKRISC